jgi:hypothetical protein
LRSRPQRPRNFLHAETTPAVANDGRLFQPLSFRDGPKDQTSDAQLHIVNFEIPGSSLRDAPE